MTREQVEGAGSLGPQLTRERRGSGIDSTRLKRELDKLRAENRRLRMEGAGELEEDDEAELLKSYLTALRDILIMRRQRKFVDTIFDRYNENLAQLPDKLVAEMYKNFMLIYLEEADKETLSRMTLKEDEVDDNVLGFAEMMTIKMGEMMDQPRHVRMAAFQNDKKRKADQEAQRLEKIERDRENFEKSAAMKDQPQPLPWPQPQPWPQP